METVDSHLGPLSISQARVLERRALLTMLDLLAGRLASLCHGIDHPDHPAVLLARGIPALADMARVHIVSVVVRASEILDEHPTDRRLARLPTIEEILDGTVPLLAAEEDAAADVEADAGANAGAVVIPFRRRA